MEVLMGSLNKDDERFNIPPLMTIVRTDKWNDEYESMFKKFVVENPTRVLIWYVNERIGDDRLEVKRNKIHNVISGAGYTNNKYLIRWVIEAFPQYDEDSDPLYEESIGETNGWVPAPDDEVKPKGTSFTTVSDDITIATASSYIGDTCSIKARCVGSVDRDIDLKNHALELVTRHKVTLINYETSDEAMEVTIKVRIT
jgi:hypothetical protein